MTLPLLLPSIIAAGLLVFLLLYQLWRGVDSGRHRLCDAGGGYLPPSGKPLQPARGRLAQSDTDGLDLCGDGFDTRLQARGQCRPRSLLPMMRLLVQAGAAGWSGATGSAARHWVVVVAAFDPGLASFTLGEGEWTWRYYTELTVNRRQLFLSRRRLWRCAIRCSLPWRRCS